MLRYQQDRAEWLLCVQLLWCLDIECRQAEDLSGDH